MSSMTDSFPGSRRFAIVGGGPKGTYALERLIAQIKKSAIKTSHIEIDVYEATGRFGTGLIYATDQPDFLLMNFSAENIDMWCDEDRFGSGVESAPTLVEWLRTRTAYDKDSFVPRCLVGCYLVEGFQSLVAAAEKSSDITLRLLSEKAESIRKYENRSKGAVVIKSSARSERRYDSVLIASGHHFRSSSERIFSEGHEITSVYPVSCLDSIPGGQNVAVRGLGLTFVDAVLSLTEGRGGKFSTQADGRYVYESSGKEPATIFPYSRSGQLMIPRGPGTSKSLPPLQNFVAERVLPNGYLEERLEKKFCFSNDIWPLLNADYHRTKTASGDGSPSSVSEKLRCDLDAIDRENPENLPASVWTRALPLFRRIYQFGGLTGEAQRQFDSEIFGELSRISFGPPAENARKILALADAGLIDFEFSKNPDVSTAAGRFSLSISGSPTASVHCVSHVNATIGRGGRTTHLSPILSSLLENGIGRFFTNDGYQPGCLDISQNGSVIDPNGRSQPVFLYGAPTEGIVHDNDTLSRLANDFASTWAKNCVAGCSDAAMSKTALGTSLSTV